MRSQLAIIIPAYKPDYLSFTLESLAQQTCKDFNVYIGDDNSPFDLYSIVSLYEEKLHICYKRFPNNIGGKNLVEQWSRCIDLSNEENWIWLFSDDDIMGPKCVELFYNKVLGCNVMHDIYHFNVSVINEEGNIIRTSKRFPNLVTSDYLYRKKESAKLESFVVEYIFSRNVYQRLGGFVDFDLAWGSDIATWIKYGHEKGIETIVGEDVYWRSSGVNITPNLNSEIVLRKLNASIEYIKWVNNFFKSQSIYALKSIYLFNLYVLFRLSVYYSHSITFSRYKSFLFRANESQIINSIILTLYIVLFPFMRLFKSVRLFFNSKLFI